MRRENVPRVSIVFERADLENRAGRRLPTRADMTSWVQAASRRDVTLTVRFVGEVEGRDLNKRYRKRDYATNVLTFDYVHEPVAEADIVICTAVIDREAREQGKSFRAHLAHMLVHATLHAQGDDHETDEEAEVMEARESAILRELGFPNPYSDRARGH